MNPAKQISNWDVKNRSNIGRLCIGGKKSLPSNLRFSCFVFGWYDALNTSYSQTANICHKSIIFFWQRVKGFLWREINESSIYSVIFFASLSFSCYLSTILSKYYNNGRNHLLFFIFFCLSSLLSSSSSFFQQMSWVSAQRSIKRKHCWLLKDNRQKIKQQKLLSPSNTTVNVHQ